MVTLALVFPFERSCGRIGQDWISEICSFIKLCGFADNPSIHQINMWVQRRTKHDHPTSLASSSYYESSQCSGVTDSVGIAVQLQNSTNYKGFPWGNLNLLSDRSTVLMHTVTRLLLLHGFSKYKLNVFLFDIYHIHWRFTEVWIFLVSLFAGVLGPNQPLHENNMGCNSAIQVSMLDILVS